MSSGLRRALGTGLLIGPLVLTGCDDEVAGLPAFEGPVGAAVLDPADGGPFDEPVGFVANSRSGTIVPLDLKHGILLADIPGAPFASPRKIATGDDRQLDQIAVWAGPDDSVTLYASDLHYSVLVEAPYLVGSDPFPDRYDATSTDPVFEDVDGSGEAPTLTDVELRAGYTTTEDWTVEQNGERWWVKGTRSGQQTSEPVAGEPYCTDRRELCFTLSGTATSGDRFTLSTDAGIVEHDLGGQILGLTRIPGRDLLIAAVWDGTAAEGHLSFFDPAQHVELGRISAGAGAMPWRFAFDDTGDTIFIGDAANPVVYALALNADDPAASTLSALVATEAPIAALAWSDTASGPRLFVALADIDRVDVLDLDSASWVDVNPLDPEVEGVYVRSPIVGMAASDMPVRLQEETAWGGRYEAPVVTLTTAAGELRMMDADTGCFATQSEGPVLLVPSSGDPITWSDTEPISDPDILLDDATGWGVAVNPCGGVAENEIWTVIYDGVTGTWRVEGTRSGEQVNPAYTAERYVSDRGEISFTLVEGRLPPTSGDAFAFQVDDGVLRIDSVLDGSGSDFVAVRQPAPPILFETENGPTGGGWDVADRRVYALLPITNLDAVARVRLNSWTGEVVWR